MRNRIVIVAICSAALVGSGLFACVLLPSAPSARLAESRRSSVVRAANAPSPLWGDLHPGPFRVGYQVLLLTDPARTWIGRSTGNADVSGIRDRPVRIGVWYPTEVETAPTMRLLDYTRVQ